MIGCRKRLFKNNVKTIYRSNYRIFQYVTQKKEKKWAMNDILRFFLNRKIIIFERWTVKFIFISGVIVFPLNVTIIIQKFDKAKEGGKKRRLFGNIIIKNVYKIPLGSLEFVVSFKGDLLLAFLDCFQSISDIDFLCDLNSTPFLNDIVKFQIL